MLATLLLATVFLAGARHARGTRNHADATTYSGKRTKAQTPERHAPSLTRLRSLLLNTTLRGSMRMTQRPPDTAAVHVPVAFDTSSTTAR
jgi:hypothetical protein